MMRSPNSTGNGASGLSWQPTKLGFEFTALLGLGTKVEPVDFPLAVGQSRGQRIPAGTFRDQCIALDELVLDGAATIEGAACVLAYDTIYGLEESIRGLLGLPSPEPVTCSVRTRGIASDSAFQIHLEIRHASHGRLEGFVERSRNAFLLGGREILLLPKAVYDLACVVDAGVPPEIADAVQARMTFQERVKRKAKAANASLEGFMIAESYILPEDRKLSATLEKIENDYLRIRPVLLDAADGEYGDEKAFERINTSLSEHAGESSIVTGVGARGARVRAVFDKSGLEAVRMLKETGDLRGADVPKFLDNPEAYLPEGLDLSDFSDRVIGIGIERLSVSPAIQLHRRDGGVLEFETKLNTQPIGFDGGAGFGGEGPTTSQDLDELIRRARDADEEYIFFKNRWVHVNVASLEKFRDAIDTARKRYEDGKLQEKDVQGFLEIFTNIEELEYGEALPILRQILDQQNATDEGPRYPIPRSLTAELLPHQLRGYAWLRFLDEQSWGGLLADDMGLGKTLQAISLLASLKEMNAVRPSLVVVPKSLLTNWQNEVRQFCPTLEMYVHHGSDRVRGMEGLKQVAESTDVVLTSYEIMRRDQISLGRIDWKAIVLDEAQNIKNPNTGAATASKSFKSQRTRLALTGTPVENGLSELWAILDFVQPGHLGSYKDFRERFEVPIQQEGSELAEQCADALRSRISDVYLRRMKEDELKGLPSKNLHRYDVEFGDEQLKLYLQLLERARNAGRGEVLGLLHRLIQVCSHPYLAKDSGHAPSTDSVIQSCPKFAKTFEILEGIKARKERVLIFTEYKAMQELLIRAIEDRFGVWAGRINGDVLTEERQRLVDTLNQSTDFGVLVLSPTAGGVGLNITGANHVIHYTRVWNPAKEFQATDRVYRIGQKRQVEVHYPIVQHPTFDTIEVRIAELLEKKAALARDIIRPSAGLSISADELSDLLGKRK